MAMTRVLTMPSVATARARQPKMPRRLSKTVKKVRKDFEASRREKALKPIFLMEVSRASTCEGDLARTESEAYVVLPELESRTMSRRSLTWAARRVDAVARGMRRRALP